jgi:hypothetical protein
MSDVRESRTTTAVPIGHERISGPQNIRNEADMFDARGLADARAAEAAREHHEGLSARLAASGKVVHDLIENMRHWGTPPRENLRPLAEALARHCAATESTVRRPLEDHGVARQVLREDREEGENLQRLLAGVIAHEPPEGTYHLTVGGILGDIDQYVLHQQRELIPVIDSELSATENRRLAGAFHA